MQVCSLGGVSDRELADGNAPFGNFLEPAAVPGYDPPTFAEAVWQQPDPSGEKRPLSLPEAGNVTGNAGFLMPS